MQLGKVRGGVSQMPCPLYCPKDSVAAWYRKHLRQTSLGTTGRKIDLRNVAAASRENTIGTPFPLHPRPYPLHDLGSLGKDAIPHFLPPARVSASFPSTLSSNLLFPRCWFFLCVFLGFGCALEETGGLPPYYGARRRRCPNLFLVSYVYLHRLRAHKGIIGYRKGVWWCVLRNVEEVMRRKL